jgi:hypothetical protein
MTVSTAALPQDVPDDAHARLEAVTAEAFATTRTQRVDELRRIRARECVDMLVDGADPQSVCTYLLDSLLSEQARIAGIRIPQDELRRWSVHCACGMQSDGLLLADADVLAARHADAECSPIVQQMERSIVVDGFGTQIR